MSRTPSKIFIFAAILAIGGLGLFVATRRAPACHGNGKIMSSQSDCLSWGFDAATCKAAVEKARAAAVRATPRLDDSIQCETQFTECFETPEGGFHPKPSFCLPASAKETAEPLELRYLQYESDRQNRKKTREVPFN